MRITPTSLAMLLALPGPAAHAQEIDPILVECLAHTYILADQADRDAEQFATEETIDAAQQFRAFSQAISYLLGTRDDCQTAIEDIAADIIVARDAILEQYNARLAEGETAGDAYADIGRGAFRCYEQIGNGTMRAAYAAFQENGPPCGWTE